MAIEYTDKLSGLFIQEYFEDRLEEELSRIVRYDRPLTLLFMQINYKHYMPEINVRWGMVYTIIKQFGALLLKHLRNVDLAGRYCGENFMVMLPETSIEGGKVLAERLRKVVSEHRFIGETPSRDIRVALDCGIATCPIHGKNASELINSGKLALERAQNWGGNLVVVCPLQLYDLEGNAYVKLLDEEEIKRESQNRADVPATPIVVSENIESPKNLTEKTEAVTEN
jgi:two-component system, cell cycle response regulator